MKLGWILSMLIPKCPQIIDLKTKTSLKDYVLSLSHATFCSPAWRTNLLTVAVITTQPPARIDAIGFRNGGSKRGQRADKQWEGYQRGQVQADAWTDD